MSLKSVSRQKRLSDSSFFVSLWHDTPISLMDESDMPVSCQSVVHPGNAHTPQLGFCPYDASDAVPVYLARVDLPSRHCATLLALLL